MVFPNVLWQSVWCLVLSVWPHADALDRHRNDVKVAMWLEVYNGSVRASVALARSSP